MHPVSELLQREATGPTTLSATRLAHLVGAGELSAEEVVAAHLQRIADLDPGPGGLHSLVHVDGEGALTRAAAIDHDRRTGRPLGPLVGVPFVVKDNIDVRRQTTSSGSRAHTDVVALRDAPVVGRLLDAGAVLIGRANMDELAMGASTHTSAFGPTRNPWDRRRSPGGSSGGSAAALAAGFAALSLGTDTGGSIREPASQCGVVGMAPSPGLVPVEGTVPFAPDFDRVGPLGRTVADTARLLAVLSDDPQLASLALHPSGPRTLRVGVVEELCGPRNHDGVLARLAAAELLLAELGIEVVRVSVPDGLRALATYMTITSAACVVSLEPYVRTGHAGDEVVRRWELGVSLLRDGRDELSAAERVRADLVAQTHAALTRCDVLLSPTMPTTAPLLWDETADRHDIHAEVLADPMTAPYTDCWTVVANLTGLPSLSLPAGRSSEDGMPVGVMLTGRAGSDGDLLALAARLEAHQLASR
ncbi:amidase [Jatrophihabitans fulvus]